MALQERRVASAYLEINFVKFESSERDTEGKAALSVLRIDNQSCDHFFFFFKSSAEDVY